MKRSSQGNIIATLFALVLGLCPAQAQAQGPLLSFGGDTAVTWVMAPIVVTGQKNPLEIFTREDFQLEVDGRPVAIESFDASREGSMSLLFFQDLSGSMANGGKLEASRQGIRCHLDSARSGDEMALVTFASGRIGVDVSPTSHLDKVAEQIANWRAYGTTALHDAITWIPKIRLSPLSTPAVLLITDGIDNASSLDPESARGIVRQAEIPVYVLALRGSQVDERRPDSTKQPTQKAAKANLPSRLLSNARVLRKLAESTGGKFFEIHHAEDVDSACRSITTELRSRYTLGFQLSTQGEETYHGLRITMPGRSVSLRHRAGYLGSAPQ